jgi:hypothetical protein
MLGLITDTAPNSPSLHLESYLNMRDSYLINNVVGLNSADDGSDAFAA